MKFILVYESTHYIIALYSSSRRFTEAPEKFPIIAFVAEDTIIFEETITSQFP